MTTGRRPRRITPTIKRLADAAADAVYDAYGHGQADAGDPASARVNRDNPTGVRTFDHGQLAALPEYAAVGAALDALVTAIKRAGIEVDQTRFLALVGDVAAGIGYADDCECGRTAWPYAATVTDGWVAGDYRCSQCSRTWSCGYAVDAPAMFS